MRVSCLRVAIAILCLLYGHRPGWAQTPPSPDPVTSELRRGDDAFLARKYADALQAYKNASKLSSDACVLCYLRLSRTYTEMKNWRDALEMADKSLTLATTDALRAQAHNLKGHALLGQIVQDSHKLEQALEEYRQAAQIDPSVASFHLTYGLALLKDSHDEEGVKELQTFLKLAPNDPQAQLATEWIAEPGRARGTVAPDFHIASSQGEEISLASLKGKIAVFDFWATWCPPCRAALPDLKDMVKKYPSDRFVLISVSVDKDEDAWRKYVQERKMTWQQYSDSKGDVAAMFGVRVIPTYVVLAGDGSILTRVFDTDPRQSIAYRLRDVLAKRPELNKE